MGGTGILLKEDLVVLMLGEMDEGLQTPLGYSYNVTLRGSSFFIIISYNDAPTCHNSCSFGSCAFSYQYKSPGC